MVSSCADAPDLERIDWVKFWMNNHLQTGRSTIVYSLYNSGRRADSIRLYHNIILPISLCIKQSYGCFQFLDMKEPIVFFFKYTAGKYTCISRHRLLPLLRFPKSKRVGKGVQNDYQNMAALGVGYKCSPILVDVLLFCLSYKKIDCIGFKLSIICSVYSSSCRGYW